MRVSQEAANMMMMTMMIRKFSFALVFLLIPLIAHTQDKDYGIWYGASLQKGIVKRLDLDVSGMIRTYENASRIEQTFLEAGLDFKITKHLSTAFTYRLTSNIENDLKHHIEQKAFIDLKENVKILNLTFSGRFRFQARQKTFYYYYLDKFPDYTGRVKLKALYRTPSFPVNPYIYVETFSPIYPKADRLIGKDRFSAGIEYKISKKHSVELEYIFQRDYLPHIKDMNIISINYNLKL